MEAAKEVHARCPPSGYEWWWNCPGVFALPEREVLETPGKAAEAGTAGHDIAARALNSMKTRWYSTGIAGPGWTPQLEKEALALGEDYRDAIGEYLEYIRHRLMVGKAELLLVEERVFPLGNGTELGELCHGTGDAMLLYGTEAEIVDLKLGSGIWVPPDSKQLKIYALGMLQRAHMAKSVTKVKATIVQPRCERPGLDTIRSVEYSADELLFDFEWELGVRVKATLDPNGTRTPGEHCRFCPRAVFCPEARLKARKLAEEDFGTEVLVVHDEVTSKLAPAEIGAILADLDAIDAWAKNIREVAEVMAIAGTPIPGRKLVMGDTHRKWNPEVITDIEPLKVASGLDEEELYNRKLLSPAQLEKKAGKGVNLSSYYHKPEGAPKLVPLSDDREPVDPLNALNSARKEFDL